MDTPNDNAFGIYVNGHRMFGSPTIKCAMNIWNFAKSIEWYHGWIELRDAKNQTLYIFKKL